MYGYVCVEPCVVYEEGQRVMVVGGGLTSAHIVSIALTQGASHVTWVIRKHLQVQSQSSWTITVKRLCNPPSTHLFTSSTVKTV